MPGELAETPSLEDLRDLEAVMGLLRDVIGSRSLSPATLEARLGWPPGKIDQWLAKPLEARLVDYIRLLRLAASSSVEPPAPGAEVRPGPDLLDSIFHAGVHRDGGGPGEAMFAPETDPDDVPAVPRRLRLMDLHVTAILVLIATGQLSAGEVIDALRFYERQIRKAGEER